MKPTALALLDLVRFRVVGIAADGREAVREARRLLPDIVIMDIVMPELSGIEAAAQIRNQCEPTKVIILSMYSTVEPLFAAAEHGLPEAVPRQELCHSDLTPSHRRGQLR